MHKFMENKQINKKEILNRVEMMLICKNNENEEYEAQNWYMYVRNWLLQLYNFSILIHKYLSTDCQDWPIRIKYSRKLV